MTNGNDMIEFEENNMERLSEEFANKNNIELSDIQAYIQKNEDKWGRFVFEQFEDANVS